ncbi:competence/damage-inducible protein A [Alkalibacter rhizosphaerae]|uniref:Putative competence-damage inducible protein n=1 Tax=Alkalibacter rhizosphaerae TaxID=2815577 RepID=A0A974XMF7_9FIRM|nr:competence/damage-inducible protein A [Alkalibacter rhizosphaerae]QSX08611.1 competence/damage-inducible protein A [Alkalibacter rhizosphaerae]
MRGEIINVGTEILIGDILNSNAQYISRELSRIGISIYYHTTVGDNPTRLQQVLQQAKERSDLVVLTGGLGPTQDDLTKESVAELFGLDMILHEESKVKIQGFFQRISAEMTQNNLKQAYMPEGARIIPNDNGTAPGILLEKDNKIFILLPGPPRELIPMFRDFCIPYLQDKSPIKFYSRYYKISGLGESALEDRLLDIIDGQTNPTIATYAKPGEVMLRITANGNTSEEATKLLDEMDHQVMDRIGSWVYAKEDLSLHEVVASMLMEKDCSISVAESCTGGLIAAKLTEIPGISSIFHSGIVCYSNASKSDYLGVKEETLEKYGAVSRECAMEMLAGLLKNNKTKIAVATTGIAGPGGGSEEKPVGLVFVGIAYKGKMEVHEVRLHGNRQQIQERSANMAFNMVRKMLEND